MAFRVKYEPKQINCFIIPKLCYPAGSSTMLSSLDSKFLLVFPKIKIITRHEDAAPLKQFKKQHDMGAKGPARISCSGEETLAEVFVLEPLLRKISFLTSLNNTFPMGMNTIYKNN